MPNAAEEARRLADLFSDASKAVDAYRSQHLNELKRDQRTRLEQIIQKLDDAHDECTADAIAETLGKMQADLEQIGKVTGEAQRALKHLNTVQEVMSIASSLAEVAEAIMTADYAGVVTGIADVTQAVSKPDGSGGASTGDS